VRKILDPASADYIFEEINTRVPWHLLFNEGAEHHSIPPAKYGSLSHEEAVGVHRFAINGAREGFQFLYEGYPLYDNVSKGVNPDFPLNAFHNFLQGKEIRNFIKAVAGISVPFHAYSQITAFGPGHFLNYHTDRNDAEKRLLAYVFNFTKGWKADWGGALHFLDADGKIEKTLNPGFNSLSIFSVPRDHFVHHVAPFAKRKRYAISGWFRENQ